MLDFWDDYKWIIVVFSLMLGSFVAGMEFNEELNRMVCEDVENE